MKIVDARCKQLVRKGKAFEGLPLDFQVLGKSHRLKAVHCVKISRGPAFFLTRGLFDGEDQQDMKEGWTKLLRFFNSILTVHVNTEGGGVRQRSKDAVARLEKDAAEALSTLELTMPAIFFHTMAHILLHVPRAVQRWGSARNFWAFTMETYMHTYSCTVVLLLKLFVIAIIIAIIVGLISNDMCLAVIRSLFLCALLATSDGSPTSFTNGTMQRRVALFPTPG